MITRSIALIVCCAFAFTAPAAATEHWFDGHAFHKVKRGTYKHRKVRRHKPRPKPAVVEKRDEYAWRCLPPMQGIGTQWPTRSGALEAAEKDWMETVRWKFGERYMDINHAVGYRRETDPECSRSSVGEVVGQTQMRCEIWARPCRALRNADGGK